MSVIRSHLNDFASEVDDQFPTLNRGGCCVFAGMVGMRLQRHLPVEVAVFGYLVGRDKEKDHNLYLVKSNVSDISNVREWNDNGIHFCHVVVEFTDENQQFHFDSYGVTSDRTRGGVFLYPGRLTVEDAISLGNKASGWNSCFDRTQIPELQQKVSNFFDMLDRKV